MKSRLLSVPVLAVIRRALPVQRRKSAIGSLMLLRLLPGWAILLAAGAFVYAFATRGREAGYERN